MSFGDIVEAEGIGCSFVNRLLRLTLLAPEIQEAILDGRQPKGRAVQFYPMNVRDRAKRVLAGIEAA